MMISRGKTDELAKVPASVPLLPPRISLEVSRDDAM
jgi:hypothetical protein